MVAQNLQWKSSLLKKKDYILTFIQKIINNNDVLIINWSMYTLQKKKISHKQIPISRDKFLSFSERTLTYMSLSIPSQETSSLSLL
jgi:hypothetical protein